MAMPMVEALSVLAEARSDQVVISTMTAAGIWPKLSDTDRDFRYIPSSMGQGPGLGLGLALAAPKTQFIVLNGDGCTLMSLASLVTIPAQDARNLWLFVMNNGRYELTGGQPVSGSGNIDYPAMAAAAGFQRSYGFDNVDAWRAEASDVLAGEGPVFVSLTIEPSQSAHKPPPLPPMSEQLATLRGVLA